MHQIRARRLGAARLSGADLRRGIAARYKRLMNIEYIYLYLMIFKIETGIRKIFKMETDNVRSFWKDPWSKKFHVWSQTDFILLQ